MLRTTLINGVTIERDTDYTAFANAVLRPGVVKGLKVISGKVQSGIGFIKVTRTSTTPSEEIILKVELTADYTLDTTGTKKVWIEVKQINVNDPGYNVPDGSGTAEIKTGTSYPSSNYIPLASITSGVITDARVPVTTVARDLNGNEYPIAIKTDGSLDMPFSISVQDIISNKIIANQLTYKRAITLPIWTNLDNISEAWFYEVFNPTSPNSTWLPWGYFYVTVERYSSNWNWYHQTATTFWSSNTPNQIYSRCRYQPWATAQYTNWERLIVWGVPKLSEVDNIAGIAPKLPNAYSKNVTPELAPSFWGNAGDLNIPWCASPWVDLLTIAWPINSSYGAAFATQIANWKSFNESFIRSSTGSTTWWPWKKYDLNNFRIPGNDYTLVSRTGSNCGNSTEVDLWSSYVVDKRGVYRFYVTVGDANYVYFSRNGGKLGQVNKVWGVTFGVGMQVDHASYGTTLFAFDQYCKEGDTITFRYSPAASCGVSNATVVECRYSLFDNIA